MQRWGREGERRKGDLAGGEEDVFEGGNRGKGGDLSWEWQEVEGGYPNFGAWIIF